MATLELVPLMIRNRKLSGLLATALSLGLIACHNQTRVQRPAQKALPPIILWAWERPENLEFLDSQRFGVAFLAQTLTLTAADVVLKPRHQPLKVSPTTKLIAVTRIESLKQTGTRAGLTVAQRERLVTLIKRTLELPGVSAIQVDFDAVSSEREFYRGVLGELRQEIPNNIPMSMTALASFCIGDPWLTGLPVDEAVPMVFRMGADDKKIRSFLIADNDFVEPLCQTSYGIALDEPMAMKFKNARRLYVFADHSWTETDVAMLEERLGK
jgi:hypothetical protein